VISLASRPVMREIIIQTMSECWTSLVMSQRQDSY